MDPNVQVALVGVMSTLITTGGVIVVSVKNSGSKKRTESAEVDDEIDENDVVLRLLTLLDENQQLDKTILELRLKVRFLTKENRDLRKKLRAAEGKE